MILITGGSGSGKSEYGEYRVMEEQMPLRFYVACMEVYGEEGRRKVERHRALRAGKGFVTLERPRGLSGLSLKGEGKKAVILECVSNLAANAMFEKEAYSRIQRNWQKGSLTIFFIWIPRLIFWRLSQMRWEQMGRTIRRKPWSISALWGGLTACWLKGPVK